MGGLLIIVASQLLWLVLAADIARFFEGLIHQTVWTRSSGLRFFAAHSASVLMVLGGPAFGTGLIFPILCSVTAQGHAGIANPVGRLTAWNYLGSVVGATIGTFVLLPILGITGSFAVLTATARFVGGLVLGPSFRTRRARHFAWGILGAVTCAILWLGFGTDVTFRVKAAGPRTHVIFHHEDGSGIVEVYEDLTSGHCTLLSSRLRQEGGNRPDDLRVQRLQGTLPVLLHPAPQQVVVELGTGINLAANLRPEVERLTCVELSPGVIRAAAFLEGENEGVLAHPKVTLVQQDGRNFLKLTRARYDLIIQDLFFPIALASATCTRRSTSGASGSALMQAGTWRSGWH